MSSQREAARRHYEANKDKMKQRAMEHTRQQRAKLRLIAAERKAVPCADCGVEYPPYVMDFDHRGDKVRNIADMVSRSVSVATLEAEIAKCEVVCANCHRKRTFG